MSDRPRRQHPCPLSRAATPARPRARRPTRPQAAGVVLPVPTSGAVLGHGCGVGSLRRARPAAWLRFWRHSVAGVVRAPALALRGSHVVGGASPSVLLRPGRGGVSCPARGCAAGSGGAGPGSGPRRAPDTPGGPRATGRWCRTRGATRPPPLSLARVSRHRPRPPGGGGSRRSGWCRRGWRWSVTGKPGSPRWSPAPQQGRAGDGG
jgi:hypothetical protein